MIENRIIIAALLISVPTFAQRYTTYNPPPHTTYGPEYLSDTDTIRVDLEKAMNVMVMDYFNYQNYLNGSSFRYFGGHYDKTPVFIKPPYGGSYYVIVDNGGDSYNVRIGVHIIKNAY